MNDLSFTHTYEYARAKMGLSRDEYALCNYVQIWSSYPGARPGWCNRTQVQMAKWVGITERGLRNMIGRMVAVGLLEKDSLTSHLRTTRTWFEQVTQAKEMQGDRNKLPVELRSPEQPEPEQTSGDDRNKVPVQPEQTSGDDRNKVPPLNKLLKEAQKTKRKEKKTASLVAASKTGELGDVEAETPDNQEPGPHSPGPTRNRAHTAEDVAAELSGPHANFFREILSNKSWPDYLLHRKEIRVRSYKSPRSEAEAVRDLYTITGGDPAQAPFIVNQSRAKGWTGLFPLKNGINGKSNHVSTQQDLARFVLANRKS